MPEMLIFKKTYDFCKWLLNHTNKFPKSHRFSVAVRLENGVLEMLRLMTLANHRQKRLPLLHAIDEELKVMQVNLRVSHELKFINIQSYEFAIKSLEEIGKMLGGWIKSQTAPKSL